MVLYNGYGVMIMQKKKKEQWGMRKIYCRPEIFSVEIEDVLLVSSVDFYGTTYYGEYYGYKKNTDTDFIDGDFEVTADDFSDFN